MALLLLAACTDRPAVPAGPPGADTTAAIVVPIDSSPSLTPSTWDPALGALLLLPQPGELTGSVVAVLSPLLPAEAVIGDTAGIARRIGDGKVALFARRGLVAERQVAVSSVRPMVGDASCPAWPIGRFAVRPQDSTPLPPRGWLVALPAGRARGVPLDSIEAMPSRDSATLAAGLTRVASTLAEDSVSAFRGLPFTVVRAYRTRGLATPVLLAVLVRRIPQEDRPLEERILIVVEQATPEVRGWRLVWHERASGREEEVIATEPLAMLQLTTTPQLVVLLGRDDGTGTSLALLEQAGGGWRIRWESPVTGC